MGIYLLHGALIIAGRCRPGSIVYTLEQVQFFLPQNDLLAKIYQNAICLEVYSGHQSNLSGLLFFVILVDANCIGPYHYINFRLPKTT